jgi:putative tryptophan/tyrosine transport system substrate-binding protein
MCALAGLAALAGSGSVHAQVRAYRIGFLGSSTPPSQFLEAFRAGLRARGLVEGRNLTIEYRSASATSEGLDAAAAELVRAKVDLIFAWATPASLAATRATATIPIVFVGVADPVGAGMVASLARPGRNVTGVSNIARDLNAKLVEFLAQVVPGIRTVAVLRNPTNASTLAQFEEAAAAARTLRLEPMAFEASRLDDLEPAFAAMARARVDGLIVIPDPMFLSGRERIAELANRHRIPSAYARREAAEAGGLLAYGANLAEQTTLAAAYVDRILKGANPAEMPIELPTRLELVVNLKTARALGLTIPQSLLLRADRTIE